MIKEALGMFVSFVFCISIIFAFIELCCYIGTKLIGGINGKCIGAAVAFLIMTFGVCLVAVWYGKKVVS